MDRRPLVIAVVGAVATLAIVALLLAVPAADRCTPSGRDLWTCLRDSFAERYMQKGQPARAPSIATAPSASPVPVDILAGAPVGPATTIELASPAPDSPISGADLPPPAAIAPASPPPETQPAVPPPASPPAADPPPAGMPSTLRILADLDPEPSMLLPVIGPRFAAGDSNSAPEPEQPDAMPDNAPDPALPPPTIDIIAFDGSGRVEGEGPPGARIQLFLDGVLAGTTRVVHGRWAIDGVDLGAKLSQELRVDAFDALSGAPLGSSSFSIEIDLPSPPHAALPPNPSRVSTEQVADLDPSPQPTAPPPSPAVESAPASPPMADTPTPAAEPDPEPAPALPAPSPPPPATTPKPPAPSERHRSLPPLRTIHPRTTSPSVTLLKGGNTGSIVTLGSD